MRCRLSPLRLLALPLCAVPALAQDVWVVDDGGGAGVDFTEIDAAVGAAADGDLVLVRDGTCSEFSIVAKSLTVQADSGHRPLVSEPEVGSGTGDPVVVVRDLAAGQEVFLRGLDVGGTYFQSFTRTAYVALSNNAGEVRIEDCDLSPGTSAFSGFTGVQAASCAGVHVARCNVVATAAEPATYGHGIEATDTNLTVWDSTVRGGPGTSGFGRPRTAATAWSSTAGRSSPRAA